LPGDLRAYFATEFVFSADGRWLSGSDGKTLRVWELPAGREHLSIPVATSPGFHPGPVFSADGRWLAFRAEGPDQSSQLRLWDVPAAREAWSIATGRPDTKLFSPDGNTLAFVAREMRSDGQSGGRLRLWDVPAGREKPPLEDAPGPWRALAFSPDGRFLATGERSHRQASAEIPFSAHEVAIWDLATCRRFGTWTVLSAVREMRFVSGGDHLLVALGWPESTHRSSATYAIIDPSASTGTVSSRWVHPVSQDGRRAVRPGGRFTVLTLPGEVELAHTPSKHEEEDWTALGFSPDNRWLAVRVNRPAPESGQEAELAEVRVFDSASGETVAVVPAAQRSECWFPAHGQSIVVVGPGQAPTIWGLPPARHWNRIIAWWVALAGGFFLAGLAWWAVARRRAVPSGRTVL
jgi:WD40 repeat protein